MAKKRGKEKVIPSSDPEGPPSVTWLIPIVEEKFQKSLKHNVEFKKAFYSVFLTFNLNFKRFSIF